MFRFLTFWRNLVCGRRVERDLDDELRATFELLVEEKVRAGMTPEQARRTHEIGIRLSLGANRSMVVGMVLRQGMRLVAIGSAIGLALGAAAGRVLSAGRFGITPPDPSVFALAAMLFMAVGLAACAVPALRATRIRPIDALRYE